MVVIEDYQHITTMDENVIWMKLTHLSSNSPLTYQPLLYMCMSFKILNTLFVHTREESYLSFMCTMYDIASNNTPFLHSQQLICGMEVHPLGNFQTMYITKALQLNQNIVIAMSSNHRTIGKTKDDPLSSPELSLIPKGIPSLNHLNHYYLRYILSSIKSY